LDNAVKYSPKNTVVTIKSNTGEWVEITIQDQGYGIPEVELPFIWDRFYKVDRAHRGNGTGLGLAIAKHLIELHKGEVSLQSELGKGTLVKICLPMV